MKTRVTALTVALYLVFLSFQPALAGAPPIQWQRTFGGSEWDEGRSVQQTTDGGYIITGETNSYNEVDPNVYLIKTDQNGISQWQKTFGGSNHDRGYSVKQTTDGGYIITGYTGLYSAEGRDVYLVKTDPNGNSQWQKTFGGIDRDCGKSVQQTTDGGYIITGFTRPFGAGLNDVYLIKTEPNGNSQWQRTFGGSSIDEGYSVQQTTDGGYIIVGETWSYGAGVSDVYLIKTDPNGNDIWQKTFGGYDSDMGSSVQQTSDGGYIIAGNTSSYGAGVFDVYLIKTDPNGNMQWQKTFDESVFEVGYSVQQTTDDGYIIAGFTTFHLPSEDSVYLIKTDPNGNKKWQKTFGGYDSDMGSSVQQTFDGGYIIAGFTHSYGAGSSDVYLIKLCPDGTLSADFNCNGTVYYEDLEVLVDQWLQPPVMLSADIFPESGDSIVNAFDFAALANDWLQTTLP